MKVLLFIILLKISEVKAAYKVNYKFTLMNDIPIVWLSFILTIISLYISIWIFKQTPKEGINKVIGYSGCLMLALAFGNASFFFDKNTNVISIIETLYKYYIN